MRVDGFFRVMLAELAGMGLDPVGLCTAAGVDPRVVHDPRVPLHLDALAAVLARAEAVTGDPDLGLHVSEHARGRGVLSHLARAQPTAGDGLRAMERYAEGVWGGGLSLVLEEDGPRTRVRFAMALPLPRHAVEYIVARTVASLRKSGVAARDVAFRHASAGTPVEQRRVLRCAPRFGQDATCVVVDTGQLARPLRMANPLVAAALAATLEGRRADEATLAERLADAVRAVLEDGGRPERETMARTLGMSGRTLARRLQAEQRDFSDVVDQVRRTLAMRLVTEPHRDLGEIASKVGFTDLAAFGKAFRRWFGTTPSAYRAAIRTHGAR